VNARIMRPGMPGVIWALLPCVPLWSRVPDVVREGCPPMPSWNIGPYFCWGFAARRSSWGVPRVWDAGEGAHRGAQLRAAPFESHNFVGVPRMVGPSQLVLESTPFYPSYLIGRYWRDREMPGQLGPLGQVVSPSPKARGSRGEWARGGTRCSGQSRPSASGSTEKIFSCRGPHRHG